MLDHIYHAWDANHVRRWHSNTDMNHFTDYIATHSARMAVLLLRFWPECRRELLVAVITHDLGECKAGDLPYNLKKSGEIQLERIKEYEAKARNALVKCDYSLTEGEYKMLKLLDRIDSHLFVLKFNPKLAKRIDWQKQLDADFYAAEDLGVEAELVSLIKYAERKAYG